MKSFVCLYLIVAICAVIWPSSKCFADDESLKALKKEIQEMKRVMKEKQASYERKIVDLQREVQALKAKENFNYESDFDEEDLEKEITEIISQDDEKLFSPAFTAVQSMNPDISLIVDTMYYNDGSSSGISEIMEHLSGFGHSHGGEEHEGHNHGSLDRGFNLREVELAFSAEVDPYLSGYAMLSFSESGSEIEEAVVKTSFLPWGFQLKGGKFLSNFGRINSQHPHSWDFVDKPLIYQSTMGYHGINEKGVQLSWLAPLPFHLLLGVEALQGENEHMFSFIGGDELPERDGPRLWVGWLKFSPALSGKHGLQFGIFGGSGVDQEVHDGNSDGTDDHWLDGRTWFAGADAVYKYDTGYEHGIGDFLIQGEYFYREKDLDIVRHDLKPILIGNDKVDKQDGYYLQTLYGFLPRWRAGLRWEQIGLINKVKMPDGTVDKYGSSWRLAAMFDFSPTEFSKIRFQTQNGDYLTEDERKNAWEFFLQVQISLGTHGAHNW